MKLNKSISIIFLFLATIVVFFNLGHVGVPRQGTEGFYLKILSEMSTNNSYLTPLYLGLPHWSKPPMHFWIALPFNEVFGLNSITAGRLGVLLFSFLALYLSSTILSCYLKFSKANIFFYFLASFGVLKYFRIYMMEIPLSLGIFLTALYYFDFLQTRKKKTLLISILWGSFVFLVKGPISLAICGLSFFAFHLYESWRNKWKWAGLKSSALTLSIYSLSTMALSSFWFIAEFSKFHMEFFNYFFLRENFGKFTSQTYSPIVLFQGLGMFALPWIFFISKDFRGLSKKLNSSFHSFIFITFLVSFFIWFIPSQRSHHYAMPALFFFLVILLQGFELQLDSFFSKVYKRSAICLIALLALTATTSFTVIFVHQYYFLALSLLLIGSFSLFYFFREPNTLRFAQSFFVLFTILWYGLIPELSLPPLSDKALTFLNSVDNSTPIYVVHRKPFFIEEYAQRKIEVIDPVQITEKLGATPSVVIFPTNQAPALDSSLVHSQWPTWRRGIKFKEAIQALGSRNFSHLYEYYTLAYRPKQ